MNLIDLAVIRTTLIEGGVLNVRDANELVSVQALVIGVVAGLAAAGYHWDRAIGAVVLAMPIGVDKRLMPERRI